MQNVAMNKNIRSFLLVFVVLCAFGLVASVWVGFKGDDTAETSGKVSTIEKLPDATIENVRYSGSKGDEREWELEADRAEHTKDSDLIVLTMVKFLYFTDNKLISTLTGKEGTYSESTGDIRIRGNVKVVSTEGYRLSTEALDYSTETKLVTTDERVKISTDGLVITGKGLEMDVDGGKITVLKDVTTILTDIAI